MTTPQEPEGLSLQDIGQQRELVKVGDKKLAVYGVSAEGIFALFQRFPELQNWVVTGKVTLSDMMTKAPATIAAIIAAGCGFPGDAPSEKKAGGLSIEVQMDIIEAIGRLTFKNGFGPFVDRIVALADQARSVNYGKVQDTILPQTSKPSPPSGTDPSTSGN